jgi:ketosteroid isomerase-like protein
MKKPFVVSAIGLSVPTLAQQQKAVDAEVRKQIEAVFTEFQDAYNKHDAAAIAALYSPDAVELRSWRGLLSGQEAIRRIFAFDFASGGGKMASELLQLCPVGNAICEIAHSNVERGKTRPWLSMFMTARAGKGARFM